MSTYDAHADYYNVRSDSVTNFTDYAERPCYADRSNILAVSSGGSSNTRRPITAKFGRKARFNNSVWKGEERFSSGRKSDEIRTTSAPSYSV